MTLPEPHDREFEDAIPKSWNGGAMNRRARGLGEVEERLRFERLIADLSSRFVNLPPCEVDREIEDAQRRACETLRIQLSTLWEWSKDDPNHLTITHLYSVPSGPARPVGIDARTAFPWTLERALRGETLVIDTDKLPPEAAKDRESRLMFNVASSVVLPLSVGGGPMIGILTFNALHKKIVWPDVVVGRLKMFAQVISNALERRRTDLLLRDGEERLRMAADSAGAGLWSLDLNGNVFWLTPKAREIFGFPAQEVITFEKFQNYVHPEDRELIAQTLVHAVRSAEDTSVSYRIRRPDGSIRWVLSRGRRRSLPGQSDSLMGVVVDETASKLSEERWQIAIQASPSSMIVVDANATIVLANRAAEELFGYTTLEIVGKSLEALVPERFRTVDQRVMREEVASLLDLGSGYRRQLRGLRKDGREIAVEVDLTPLSTPDGPLLLASIIDITARRQAELEAGRARAEIARLSRSAMLGELAGVLAHEMSQPLSAILLNAHAASRLIQRGGGAAGEMRAILSDIITDGQRAGDAILRLRMLLTKEESQFEPVNLNDVVQDVLVLIRFDLLAPGTRIGAHLAPDLPDVLGDRRRLKQALLNLVVNASDAMSHLAPADRQLVVCTEHLEEATVSVSVTDCGCGIDTRVKEKMFESFFTTKPGGLGIGLPISHIIAAAHGGVLNGENNPDRGSTFRITLPCAPRQTIFADPSCDSD